MMIRQPAVAGQFYTGDSARLKSELATLIGPRREGKPAVAVIAPHAGYMYSGAVAGMAYAEVVVPKTVVILGLNHTGLGSPAAVMSGGAWNMPMGRVPIAEDLAIRILEQSRYLEEDIQAHIYEHSLEVQVPFLQYRQPGLTIVPVCFGALPYAVCEEVGTAIARAVEERGDPALLVASTDMTHYESQERTEAQDRLAIDRVLAMDAEGLLSTVRNRGISMCGVVPTTVALVASKALGARSVRLVRYATSGDVTGDYRRVVGYASFIVA